MAGKKPPHIRDLKEDLLKKAQSDRPALKKIIKELKKKGSVTVEGVKNIKV